MKNKYIKKEIDHHGIIRIFIINNQFKSWLCVLTTCQGDLAQDIYNAYKKDEYIEKNEK